MSEEIIAEVKETTQGSKYVPIPKKKKFKKGDFVKVTKVKIQ